MSLKSMTKTCLRFSAIVAVFIAVNFELAPRLTPQRLDLTEQKLYSLSPGTRQILAELTQPMDLYLYFSSQAARDQVVLRSYAARVEALLLEYQREAHGQLKLHVIDPAAFSPEESRAVELGLQPLDFGEGTTPVYFGLALVGVNGEHASIPMFSLDQQTFLEYDISHLMQRISHPQRPLVGLMSMLPLMGGFDTQTGHVRAPWMMARELGKAFELREVSAQVAQVPDEIHVMMLVHPKRLPETTVRALDQFVLRGGRLLVFVDPYSEQDSGDTYFGIPSKDKSSDLASLFKAWGVRLMPDRLLGDAEYAQYVTLQPGGDPVWQPVALELLPGAMNAQHVITAGLGVINLSTSGILYALKDASTTLTPLLYSSSQAMPIEASRLDHLKDPGQLGKALVPTGERYLIAAHIQGPANSAFADLPLKQAEHINVIVVADTDLLSNNLWTDVQGRGERQSVVPWADNAVFVLNALDSMSGSDALISLRSRGHYSRTFTVVEQLRHHAQADYRRLNTDLQKKIDQTQQQLMNLAAGRDQNTPLTAEQQTTIKHFTAEKRALEQQMRKVALQLNVQVEQLGMRLRLINIGLIPVLFSSLFLCAALWRWHVRKRKRR